MHPKTVLVVDDEADIRESLQDALTDEGYAVSVASNGREALEVLARIARPCVVILDVIMPIMSGAEVYEVMRSSPEWADIPVLISTSDPSRAPSEPPLMKKPINLERLLKTVADLFPRQTSVVPPPA